MKLGEALLCCNCDELFMLGPIPACPSCTSVALFPLSRFFIKPIEEPERIATATFSCPDCAEAKRAAYSDASTPGFLFEECEKHRRVSLAAALPWSAEG